MKNLKKVGVVLLIIAILTPLISINPIVIADNNTNEDSEQRFIKHVTAMKPGDVIYFDNSGTNWESVYIYIWDKNKNPSSYKEWGSEDEMEKIQGTNIYKFTVPENMGFETSSYKNLIFRSHQSPSGTGNTAKNRLQTIDLGFIESGFAYKVNSEEFGWNATGDKYIGGLKKGYWYLYNKESRQAYINLAKQQYQTNKIKYTDESYSNLDQLIADAETEIDKEIVLYNVKDENQEDIANSYYIQIDVILDNMKKIIDNLQIDKRKINIITDGNGSVTTNQTDNSQVPFGESVTLTSTPNEYYEIESLTVVDENNNNVTLDSNNKFSMPKSDVTVNATFRRIKKAITTISENGSVTTNQTDDSLVNAGDTVKLTLTPNQWCELESLTVTDAGGNNIPLTNNTFTMPASNVKINAKFKEMNKIHDIVINETENGSVETNVGPENVTVETPVKMTIIPNYGYELDTLTVKDENGAEVQVTNNTFSMPITNAEITATFKHIKKSVALNNPEVGKLATNQIDNSKVNVGDTVKLTLTPNVNYEIDTLTVTDENGTEVPVTNNTFTMPNSNVKVEAKYKRITKAITISNSDNGKATVNVEDLKNVNAGEAVKITAIPNDGCEVKEIIVTDEEGNKIAVSSDNTFVMPAKNVIITTTFKNNNVSSGDNNPNSECTNTENNTENVSDAEENGTEENKGTKEQTEDVENTESLSEKAGNNKLNPSKILANTPKTGDAIIIVAVILVVSVIVFIILSKKSKKNSKKNNRYKK